MPTNKKTVNITLIMGNRPLCYSITQGNHWTPNLHTHTKTHTHTQYLHLAFKQFLVMMKIYF